MADTASLANTSQGPSRMEELPTSGGKALHLANKRGAEYRVSDKGAFAEKS